MAKPNKAVVVFSGGQDSTTCLFWAKKKYDEVIALSFMDRDIQRNSSVQRKSVKNTV